MKDKDFENEFNDFFNGDGSLFNKIGEERAKKIYELLKTLKDYGELDGVRVFGISEPFSTIPTSSNEPEIIKEWEDGNFIIKKIWRDENGKIINMEFIVTDSQYNETITDNIVVGTLEELLNVLVEVEDYDNAALVRDLIIKDNEFQLSYWEEMEEAVKAKSNDWIRELMEFENEQKRTIDKLLLDFKNYFKK